MYMCLVKCFTILFDKIERLLSDVYIYGMRTYIRAVRLTVLRLRFGYIILRFVGIHQ